MTIVPMTGDGAARAPRTPLYSSIALYVRYVLWGLFVLCSSTALWQYTSDHPERYAWLIADFTVACLLLRYQSQFINIALSNPIFTSWGLIAAVSAAWSAAPSVSLYQGIQLLMTTLVAFLICIHLRLHQFVAIIFWAMLVAAVVALVSAVLPPNIGIDYVGNWRGAFPSKNVMGDAMILLIISACCLFLQGRWRLISTGAIALGMFLIFMTRSATPILSVFLTLAPVPYAYALVRGRTAFLFLLGITLTIASGAVIIAYITISYYGADPVGAVLSLVGKERSLTGRTLLWDLAADAIEKRPWLGYGYNGYWAHPPAEMLQVRAAFRQAIAFFHNNFLEVTVAYGVIGPILLLLGIIVALVRSVRRLFYTVDPIEIWPLLIVLQVLIQAPVQNPLLANHSLWHVVFVAAAVIRR